MKLSLTQYWTRFFGVVNNKQHAHGFVEGAGFNWKDENLPGEFLDDFKERLKENLDPKFHLIDIWDWIDKQIIRMRDERRKLMRGTGRSRHPDTGDSLEDTATSIINEQKDEGDSGGAGSSDFAPETSDQEKIIQITESAERRRVDSDIALDWATETVRYGRRIIFKEVSLGHRHAFFDVESVNDVIEVWLNDQHPVYKHLVEVLRAENENLSSEILAERIEKASFTLKMLLIAWARYEDKAPAAMRDLLSDIRMDWGREARKFISSIFES